ncbi:hypothetical protein PhCBS80983_g02740 [Powellomyces hirtus]|uniref:Cyclic nucleotide-binding domain-containing protein n=1 Tax=Powellomyces hirtus TaxID=109895 RepID=A0A507E5E5_9FUNG|nr:hypothetical protein PhCBS80983_g02740 [Powellomyces hirtus]
MTSHALDECMRQLIVFNDQLRSQHASLTKLQNEMNVLMLQVRTCAGTGDTGETAQDGVLPGSSGSGSFLATVAVGRRGSPTGSLPLSRARNAVSMRTASPLEAEYNRTTSDYQAISQEYPPSMMDEAVERAISMQFFEPANSSNTQQEKPGILKSLSMSIAGSMGFGYLRTRTLENGPKPLMLLSQNIGDNHEKFWHAEPNEGMVIMGQSVPSIGNFSATGVPRRHLNTIFSTPAPSETFDDLERNQEPDEENNISRSTRSGDIQQPVAQAIIKSEGPVSSAPPAQIAPPPPPPTVVVQTPASQGIWTSVYLLLCAVPRYNEFRAVHPPAEFQANLKNVYSSNPSLLLHPRSLVRVWWDFFMSVLYIVTLFAIPIGVSFSSAHVDTLAISTVLCLMFSADTLLNFVTLVISEGHPLPLLQSVILYLRFDFWLDLLTSLPLHRFLVMGGITSPNIDAVLLVRLIRLRKFYPILVSNPIYGHASTWVQSAFGVGGSFMSVWLFGGLLLIYLHMYACGIFLMGELTDYESWQSPELQEMQHRSMGIQYTWAFFSAIANTFPITGFRPVTAYEQWCTIVSCLMGALLYASLVGTISSFSFGLDSSGRLYKEKMDEVNEYMHYKNLSQELKNKVRQYFQLKYRGKYFDEAAIMKELNDSLREEITVHNCRDLIAKVNFLSRNVGDGRDHNFLGRIASALKAVYYIQGDTIFEQGRVGNEMYFILSGTVEIIVGSNRVGALSDGAFFGEVALLGDVPRTATIKAAADTVAYRLNRSDLQSILTDFDDMAVKIRLVYEERMAKVRLEKQAKEAKEAEMQQQKAIQESPNGEQKV